MPVREGKSVNDDHARVGLRAEVQACVRYFDVVRNGTFREELRGKFKTLTDQDVEDGALYFPVGLRAFNNNTLMLQNRYWKRNGFAF